MCVTFSEFSARYFYLILYFIFNFSGGYCLDNVTFQAPLAITAGTTVSMKCLYDLQGEALYMVKWYKGRSEFFRYVPKEHPHTRIFPLPGVNVDISRSGPNEVVLTDGQKDLAGRYRCEVSADAPSFQTAVVGSQLHVIYAPPGSPKLTLEKSQYSIGDTLRGNCTSLPSKPAANITFYINDKQINASYVNKSSVPADKLNGNISYPYKNLWITTAGLKFEVNTFTQRQLRVVCETDLYQVWSTKAQVLLQEERPRLASILYPRESSAYSSMKEISKLQILLVFATYHLVIIL